MLAKLGHLLYWVGSGLAAVALVSGVFILQHGLDRCEITSRYSARPSVYIFS
jgi:hypothetical protein